MSKFFVAKGETAAKLQDVLDRRDAVRKKAAAWAKNHGSRHYGLSESAFGVNFSIQFLDAATVDKSLWKSVKGCSGFYLPRRTSKASKAICAELEKLDREMPGNPEVAKAIDFEIWSGDGYVRRVGVGKYGKQIVLMTHDGYTPKKGIQLQRISDLEYEKILRKSGVK